MTTNTLVNTKTNEDITTEVNNFGMKVLLASAVIVGLWGAGCLIAGLVATGPVGMSTGLLVAIGI